MFWHGSGVCSAFHQINMLQYPQSKRQLSSPPPRSFFSHSVPSVCFFLSPLKASQTLLAFVVRNFYLPKKGVSEWHGRGLLSLASRERSSLSLPHHRFLQHIQQQPSPLSRHNQSAALHMDTTFTCLFLACTCTNLGCMFSFNQFKVVLCSLNLHKWCIKGKIKIAKPSSFPSALGS